MRMANDAELFVLRSGSTCQDGHPAHKNRCQVPGQVQVSEKMAEPGANMDALMTRMDRLQTQIEAADGWELERQLERAMDALRCPPGNPPPPLHSQSLQGDKGGQCGQYVIPD